MAKYSGTALYVAFGGVVVNTEFRTFDDNTTIDLIDVTAGADAEKEFINSHGDATFNLSILLDSAGTAIPQALYRGASGTLIWGPRGTAAGSPKFSCVAIVKDHKTGNPYDDASMFDVTFQKNGAWIANNYISASVFP